MKDRIKKIRKELDLTQQAFADKIGMKQNTIAQYEMGRTKPSDAIVFSICREFNVNEVWLRTGKGEMFQELTEQQKILNYSALLLKEKDSAVAKAIQTLIVTYEQLDDASKVTLEKIASQYISNWKMSQ
ncbi:MAG: helix-turn-helix transcriptional regulator [Dorea sp.]|nr:helix-turn-helix transcriptional regulator [Dorea sp.]